MVVGAEVPGVVTLQDLGDAGLAVEHQPMDPPQDLADVVEVVLGRQLRGQAVVVGAALAVDQDELDRWAGGELAELVGHEHGLAEPGQPSHDDAGDPAMRTRAGRESSAQPSHHDSRETGAMPDRSTRAGARSGS